MPIFTNRAIEWRERVKPIAKAGEPKALLRRAQFLGRDDRLLVELSLKGHANRDQLAEVFRIRPGTVTRRMQSLAARLYDPLVIDLLDDSVPLPPEYRQVGVEYFLQHRSAVTIAERHRMRAKDIRKMVTFLRGWHRGLRTQRDWIKVVGWNRPRGQRCGRRLPHISVA